MKLRNSFFLFAAAPLVAVAAPPTNSAYNTDPQQSYVQDATSDSIGQVNMIACVVHALRLDALVNQDPYIALIDKNTCDAQKSVATSSASSSASQAPDYMTAVVKSTRASNAASDPMIGSAWISMNQDGTPVTIYAHISATEAPSTSNPYGAFRLDYCGRPDGAQGGGCLMNGFMVGGNGTLSYYEADANGGGGGDQITALQLSSVGTTTGSGTLSVQDPGNGNSAFNFAYNGSYFLRDDGTSNPQCFSRDASDPGTGMSVWQYGLYDSSTGARVDRNSGFPIQVVSNGVTSQGYLGYFGLQLPPQVNITSGTTVQKVDYNSGSSPTTTNYTAVVNGGRLTRFTKKSQTLKAIDQIHFTAFIQQLGGTGLPNANTQYDMYWDDTAGSFVATAQMQCGPSGCNNTPLSPMIHVSAAAFFNTGLQGWSQSLGGDLLVDFTGASGAVDSSNSANFTVVYHTQDIVYPGDQTFPNGLVCAGQCPTAATIQNYLTQSQSGQVQSPYVPVTQYNLPVTINDLVYYGVDSNGRLVGGDGSATPVIDANADDYQNPNASQFSGGINSGKLVESNSLMLCNTNLFCDYAVMKADVYYQWQTGPNTYNQFAAVKDSTGQFVKFDPPLDVTFKVPSGAQYGSYAGTNLILQYSSFGNLQGIPGSCVSATTNQPVACTNDPSVRYVPQFVIPYDPSASPQQGIVTSTSNGVATTYLVKWLNREIRFAQKGANTCVSAGLSAPTNVQLPTQSQLKDPSNSSSDVYLGAKPTVTSAPRVVQGDVKY